MCSSALWTSRPSSILIMGPTHLSFLDRFHLTRLKVVVLSVASSRLVLPVMCDSMPAFAPFIILHVCSSRTQASEPYVSIEQHADLYSLIFSLSDSSSAPQICRSFPALDTAIATRRFTSGVWSPSAWKRLPRYSKIQQFLIICSPQNTFSSSF